MLANKVISLCQTLAIFNMTDPGNGKDGAAPRILLIEPFYVGSHKQLVDVLHKKIRSSHLITLPGKKWQWKARTSALYLSQVIPNDTRNRTLFASSVLNLAELVSLRPDLAVLHKVLYFHENQLVYPVRKQQDRDFQYGYNQILSCLVADVILFNSHYNKDSFLSSIASFLKLIPDHRPTGIPEQLKPKCHVVYFPIMFPTLTEKRHTHQGKWPTVISSGTIVSSTDSKCHQVTEGTSGASTGSILNVDKESKTCAISADGSSVDTIGISDARTDVIVNSEIENEKGIGDSEMESFPSYDEHTVRTVKTCALPGTDEYARESVEGLKMSAEEQDDLNFPLHIVWPHRWEHDKGPDTFFQVINQLLECGCDFRLSVLGEAFTDVPAIFEESRARLQGKIKHWGYLPSKQDYYDVLHSADCVVSTANHEFFGVAMLEAVHSGCFPLCPNRLVYPEIFPKECLYNTDQQLFKRLRDFCRKPNICRRKRVQFDTNKFAWETLEEDFMKYLYVCNDFK